MESFLGETEFAETLKAKSQEQGDKILVDADEDIANEIRDLAGEKLQERGFDDNLELTAEGQILEDLIDIFYTK